MATKARETAEVLLQIGRLVHAVGYHGAVNPAQWMALRYFSRANSFSRTPSAFAEFQATTRGTASTAIKELKAGGYLTHERSKTDRRSIRLRLTAKGAKALARDPFKALVDAVDALDVETKSTVHDALDRVLASVAARAGHQRFGVCQNCTHLREEKSSDPASTCALALVCGLHRTAIQADELDLLCAYFSAGVTGPLGQSKPGRRRRAAHH